MDVWEASPEQGPPPALLNEPEIPEHLAFAHDAFWDLCSDRPMTLAFQGMAGLPHMVFGAIPFLAIDRYATRYGIDTVDDFERFHALVSACDAEWRMHANAKRGG